jgi:hypothetical protein
MFDVTAGLLQGEALSQFLFSMYVNDFEDYLFNENCTSIDLAVLNLFLLIYADDTFVFSETVDGLQNILNKLSEYCNDWKLTVNVAQIKGVVFRHCRLRPNECWTKLLTTPTN